MATKNTAARKKRVDWTPEEIQAVAKAAAAHIREGMDIKAAVSTAQEKVLPRSRWHSTKTAAFVSRRLSDCIEAITGSHRQPSQIRELRDLEKRIAAIEKSLRKPLL
jgi:hypothetical protein